MGKRSSFERRPRDKYRTQEKSVLPLLPYLEHGTMFVEPCAGDGRLVRHLEKHGMSCLAMFDIEPDHPDVDRADAFGEAAWALLTDPSVDYIITNPPWTRSIMHRMMETFRAIKPTWLLHDSDWLFTKQAAPYKPYIRQVVTAGRARWIDGTDYDGKENAVWTLHVSTPGQTLLD